MKKLYFVLLIIGMMIFAGCSQAQQPEENKIVNEKANEPVVVEENAQPESADYVGYWLRTAVYINGEFENDTPATLDLRADDYYSMGTCEGSGRVFDHGDNKIELVLDATNCPGVSAGLSVVYTYTIGQDEEKEIKTMVLSTGYSTETFELVEK